MKIRRITIAFLSVLILIGCGGGSGSDSDSNSADGVETEFVSYSFSAGENLCMDVTTDIEEEKELLQSDGASLGACSQDGALGVCSLPMFEQYEGDVRFVYYLNEANSLVHPELQNGISEDACISLGGSYESLLTQEIVPDDVVSIPVNPSATEFQNYALKPGLLNTFIDIQTREEYKIVPDSTPLSLLTVKPLVNNVSQAYLVYKVEYEFGTELMRVNLSTGGFEKISSVTYTDLHCFGFEHEIISMWTIKDSADSCMDESNLDFAGAQYFIMPGSSDTDVPIETPHAFYFSRGESKLVVATSDDIFGFILSSDQAIGNYNGNRFYPVSDPSSLAINYPLGISGSSFSSESSIMLPSEDILLRYGDKLVRFSLEDLNAELPGELVDFGYDDVQAGNSLFENHGESLYFSFNGSVLTGDDWTYGTYLYEVDSQGVFSFKTISSASTIWFMPRWYPVGNYMVEVSTEGNSSLSSINLTFIDRVTGVANEALSVSLPEDGSNNYYLLDSKLIIVTSGKYYFVDENGLDERDTTLVDDDVLIFARSYREAPSNTAEGTFLLVTNGAGGAWLSQLDLSDANFITDTPIGAIDSDFGSVASLRFYNQILSGVSTDSEFIADIDGFFYQGSFGSLNIVKL
ncbi:MAG: hypothetical protein COB51_08605 [Moraxellaceae bacterium]|nr:MAG: hypothetical protein COB51_08605 [Moraxellaceae bacterium]